MSSPRPPPLDLCERRTHRALKCLEHLLSDYIVAVGLPDDAAACGFRATAASAFEWENPIPHPDVGR